MSWKKIGEVPVETETGYCWLYDSSDGAVVLLYVADVEDGDFHPDYTHWMADGESPEEPDPPEDN